MYAVERVLQNAKVPICCVPCNNKPVSSKHYHKGCWFIRSQYYKVDKKYTYTDYHTRTPGWRDSISIIFDITHAPNEHTDTIKRIHSEAVGLAGCGATTKGTPGLSGPIAVGAQRLPRARHRAALFDDVLQHVPLCLVACVACGRTAAGVARLQRAIYVRGVRVQRLIVDGAIAACSVEDNIHSLVIS